MEDLQTKLDDATTGDANVSVEGGHGNRSIGGDTTENWKVIREELHRQSGYLRSLETANMRLTSEVGKLRQQAGMVEVLKEEKLDLQRKVEGMDGLRKRAAELEGQLALERTKKIERYVAHKSSWLRLKILFET